MRAYLLSFVATMVPLAATPGTMAQVAPVKVELDRAALNFRPTGVDEAAVPVIYIGSPSKAIGTTGVDRFKIIEIIQQTPGTGNFPIIWSDLVSIFYLRSCYQKADQKPGETRPEMATSVIGSPCFRTPAGRQFLPSVAGSMVRTNGRERITCEVWGHFQDPAEVLSIHSYPEPKLGRTETKLSVRFRSLGDIKLDPAQRGQDAFRLLTVSSMYTDKERYDANVLRYEDKEGAVHSIRLTPATPRGGPLLVPKGTELGGWFELIKEPGSKSNPESPTIRIEIADRSDVPGRLGLQAFLTDSKPGVLDPKDDSFSVWVEWLDAPEVVPADTSLRLDARIIATPPSRVVEPGTAPGH